MIKCVNLLLLGLMMSVTSLSFSQDQDITPEQQEIYELFSLYPNDSRGVEFTSSSEASLLNCTESHTDIKSAIESVFNSLVMKDYILICIDESEGEEYFEQAYTIRDLVDIYITVQNSN